MLDSLAPTDPVLLLAVVDGAFSELPRDVKAWFGPTRDNRVELVRPTAQQREQFFEKLIKDVTRPPNHFPDGIQRKKRVLEELPIAPPLEPRQPTAAELAIQQDADQRTLTMLKFRLGPILQELKRKFKRFTKRASVRRSYFTIESLLTDFKGGVWYRLRPIAAGASASANASARDCYHHSGGSSKSERGHRTGCQRGQNRTGGD